MTKGFITLAVGEYYCKLAEHLYMSYKLFSGCNYPFYVITDENGKNRLSKLFDGVIVKDGFTNSSVDKICIFTESPFDETIFIDADSSVVNDLNYVFDVFEKNGSDLSAISRTTPLAKGENGVQFTAKTAELLGIKKDFPKFNGGVYYFRRSSESAKAFDFMFNELYPHYFNYELKQRHNSTRMADEPLVIAAMLKYGMETVPVESNIMFLLFEKKDKVKWNMKKRVCSYPWEDKKVSPSIIHWKFGGTETNQYERYDAEVRGRFLNQSKTTVLYKKGMSFF